MKENTEKGDILKIAFYDTKPYDRIWFEPLAQEYNCEIRFFDYRLNKETAALAKGYDTVCAFVNDKIDAETIDALYENSVKLIALRCAGYNNVDFKAAYGKVHVVRVPSYSPTAVAEHAAALLFAVNRNIHRAYNRTRENNFNINGLMGFDLRGKTAGVIGTGKIGRVFIDIARGIGMKVVAYDPYPADDRSIEYLPLDELYKASDVISIHCPLTKETRHMINEKSIAGMKDGVVLINTSRGEIVDTEAVIEALKQKKIGACGLDVYEEEDKYFFEDKSNENIEDDVLARLLTFNNVIITSHQGFFTKEAMKAIAEITMQNVNAFEDDELLENEICYNCPGGDCNKKAGQKRCF